MTSSRNTLKTSFRVPKFLGSGHFSLVPGLNYSKKSKLAYPQKLQETSHFWTLAAALYSLKGYPNRTLKNAEQTQQIVRINQYHQSREFVLKLKIFLLMFTEDYRLVRLHIVYKRTPNTY